MLVSFGWSRQRVWAHCKWCFSSSTFCAQEYARDKGLSETDMDWLYSYRDSTKEHKRKVRGAWKAVAASLPHRTIQSVYCCGSRMLHEGNYLVSSCLLPYHVVLTVHHSYFEGAVTFSFCNVSHLCVPSIKCFGQIYQSNCLCTSNYSCCFVLRRLLSGDSSGCTVLRLLLSVDASDA